MKELFNAELSRFRLWLIAAALLHLGVLGFMGRMVDPLQQPVMVYQVVGAVYAVVGLLFGLFQMGGYRRPNTWLNLLHRPLPRTRIGAALHGAGAVLLFLAVAAPLFAMIAGQATLTARVVDARHWLLPLAAWLIALCSYLAGSYAMLASRRWSALSLVLPMLIAASAATGLGAIAMQLLLVVWTGCLVFAAFKPDLSAAPTGTREIATALPVQLALYLLLVMASLGYQLVWIMLGSHPLNGRPPAGGYVEASRGDAADVLVAGLAGSTHADTALWKEQVRLSQVYTLGAQIEAFPVRGEITNLMPMEFDDDERRLRWTFSHDRMRFQGVRLADGQAEGELGIGESQAPFPKVPLPAGNLLVSADTIYAYDTHRKDVRARIVLPEGETLAAGPTPAGETLAVLGDRALYFYDARAWGDGEGLLTPLQRIALPGAVGGLDRIDLVELLDGQLISFVFGRDSVDDHGAAWQELWRLDGSGQAQRISQRELTPDFPAALRHYAWWLSPVGYELRRAVVGLFAPENPLERADTVPRPPLVQALAGLNLLLSLIGAWLLTRRQGLVGTRRLLWVLNCGVFGLPALVALRLIHTDREQDVVVLARPAIA